MQWRFASYIFILFILENGLIKILYLVHSGIISMETKIFKHKPSYICLINDMLEV